MSTSIINCPNCKNAMQIPTAVQPGARFRCPTCMHPFGMQVKKAMRSITANPASLTTSAPAMRPNTTRKHAIPPLPSIDTKAQAGFGRNKARTIAVIFVIMAMIVAVVLGIVFLKPSGNFTEGKFADSNFVEWGASRDNISVGGLAIRWDVFLGVRIAVFPVT